MLVLTRKPSETIQIGDNITVRVLQIRGNTVRLGIEAPREIRVMRTELCGAVDIDGVKSIKSVAPPITSPSDTSMNEQHQLAVAQHEADQLNQVNDVSTLR